MVYTRRLTVSSEVVVKDLEEREGVPSVWRLLRQDLVHVHSEHGPEELTVLHQQVAEPGEGLQCQAVSLGWQGKAREVLKLLRTEGLLVRDS